MYYYQIILYESIIKKNTFNRHALSSCLSSNEDGGKCHESKHRVDKDSDPSSGQSGGLGSGGINPPASGGDASFNVSIITFYRITFLEAVGDTSQKTSEVSAILWSR